MKFEDGEAASKDHHPHDQTHEHGLARRTQTMCSEWKLKSDVAVHRDAHAQHDAAVDVDVEQALQQGAEGVTKSPLLLVCMYLEGQRQDQQAVVDDQVDEVNRGFAQAANTEEQQPQSGQVQREAEDHNGHIHTPLDPAHPVTGVCYRGREKRG